MKIKVNKKKSFCSDGKYFHTDFVVVGLGIKPNIELAKSSGLECNNGILVNENGQTSDPNIYAAGDCSNHPNNIFKQRLRLESVQNAVEQAKNNCSIHCWQSQAIPRGSLVLVRPIQYKATHSRNFKKL